MNTKIAIAVASNREMKIGTYLSLMNLAVGYQRDLLPLVATDGYDTAENRNYCVFNALRAGCSHILFVDDDMVFPPDTLERLLNHDKDIIGTVYNSRMFPPTPTIALEDGSKIKDGDKLEPLIKCSYVGTGVMLIKLDIFKTIEKPWFHIQKHENGYTLFSDDCYFCKQVIKQGYEVWCDTTIKVGHLGLFTY